VSERGGPKFGYDGLIVKFQHETEDAYAPLAGEDARSCGFAGGRAR
jgi:hypothetical protein